jgi:hypothetical protein
MENNMIVVDFSQVVIATYCGELGYDGIQDSKVEIDYLRHMVMNTLRSYRRKFGGEYGEMVIACDNKKYWRRDKFPEYKAHRKKDREKSSVDWDGLFLGIETLKSELDEYFPYPVIDIGGAEADDVIGALAEYSQTAGDGGLFDGSPIPYLILSGDHDFNQLQKYANVKQYSPIEKKWIKIKEPAEHVLMEHIIIGDKGDGVPNILSEDRSFVDGIRQKSIFQKKLDVWKKSPPEEWVTEAMSQNYNRNRLMVDLSKTPQEIKDAIITTYEENTGGDRSKILGYFVKNRMRGFFDSVSEF